MLHVMWWAEEGDVVMKKQERSDLVGEKKRKFVVTSIFSRHYDIIRQVASPSAPPSVLAGEFDLASFLAKEALSLRQGVVSLALGGESRPDSEQIVIWIFYV